jgi:hypothetical protein
MALDCPGPDGIMLWMFRTRVHERLGGKTVISNCRMCCPSMTVA